VRCPRAELRSAPGRLRPDLTGLYVGISPLLKDKTFDTYPKNLKTLVSILTNSHIHAEWAFGGKDDKEEAFSLVVGNAP
jgi:hypothetical protein